MIKIKKLLICVGLPASGKTLFAKQYVRNNYDAYHIDVDYLMYEDTKYELIENEQERFIEIIKNEVSKNYEINIIDALILTNDDIVKILIHLSNIPDDVVEIHYWNENKNACLTNDRFRRKLDSKITIENCKLDIINIDHIEQKLKEYNYGFPYKYIPFDIELVEHEVYEKTIAENFIEKYDTELKNGYIVSQKWKTGGEWWSYTGAHGSISSEEPVNFTELDDLLEKICPNISFLKYKKILEYCVDINTDTIRDYYSNEEVAWYECDIEKLYEKLIEMNIIGG